MILAAAFLMLLASAPADVPGTLTFSEALEIAQGTRPRVDEEDLAAALRGPRLPHVRIETTGNTSRTLDPFTSDPLQINSISSILAADYPLLDGGVRSAQLAAIEARQRRATATSLDEPRFEAIVEAFGDLFLAQQQEEVLRPWNARIEAESERATRLLQSGEITNLEAASRRSQATAGAQFWLDLQARREDASARLMEILRLPSEPRLALDDVDLRPAAEETPLRDRYLAAMEVSLEEARMRVRTSELPSRLTATLSGFAGVTSASSEFRDVTSSGTFGIYGLRVHLAYPLIRNASLAAAEARLALVESTRLREEAEEAARKRADSLRRQLLASERQTELLQQQREEARLTAASVQRLSDAGLRTNTDVVFVALDVARLEAELLAAQVRRWKSVQRLRWLSGSEWPRRP